MLFWCSMIPKNLLTRDHVLGFSNFSVRNLSQEGFVSWFFPDYEIYFSNPYQNGVRVSWDPVTKTTVTNVFGRTYHDHYVDKGLISENFNHGNRNVMFLPALYICADSGIAKYPTKIFDTDGYKLFSVLLCDGRGETTNGVNRIIGDQRGHFNKPIPMTVEFVNMINYSKFMIKEKHDGVPVFIWGDGKVIVVVDLDGNVLPYEFTYDKIVKHKVIHPLGQKTHKPNKRAFWIQCELVNGRFCYVDGKIDDFVGSFYCRKNEILNYVVVPGLILKDEWQYPCVGFDFDQYRNKEGFVVQLDDVLQPTYTNFGKVVRTSFYVKNTYTLDLSRQLYFEMFPRLGWIWPPFSICEFTAEGVFVRQRSDKARPNSELEIHSVMNAIGFDDFALYFEGLSIFSNGEKFDSIWEDSLIDNLSDDLSDLSVQQFMVSSRDDALASRKRKQIVAKVLLVNSEQTLVSIRLKRIRKEDVDAEDLRDQILGRDEELEVVDSNDPGE